MSRGRARVLLVAATALCAASAACSALIGLEAPPDEGGDASANGVDAATDSLGPGPPADGGTVTCASLAAGDAGPYFPFAQVPRDDAGHTTWETFDSTLLPVVRSAGYWGGTFDGRYVYYASQSHYLVRFDTTGSFGDPAAWSEAVLPDVAGVTQSFNGAVFDGRYVIFVPALVGQSSALAARFDTALEDQFTATTSAAWQQFDVSTLAADGGAPTAGYAGGVFDGRYVYLVPRNDGPGPFGRVARFDTAGSLDAAVPDASGQQDDGSADAGDDGDGGGGGAAPSTGFANPAAWSTFDLTSVHPALTGYVGGVFAAGSVLLAPEINDYLDAEVNGGVNATVVRFAPDGGFTSKTAWTTFDTTRVHGESGHYLGGVFDGRFVYFVPHGSGVVVRYDTQASFGAPSAWSYYDSSRTMTVDGDVLHFFGGAFDGRFVYFVPNESGASVALRYDTLSTFEAPCAWSTFDVGQLAARDAGTVSRFIGAVFDGQFVYLVPNGAPGTAFVRFAAKPPGPLPRIPYFYGSFL